MTPEWICKLDGQEQQPLTFDELKQLASEGRIDPQTQVRRSRDERWFRAAQIPGLLPPSTSGKPASAKPPVLEKAKSLAPPAPPLAAPSVPAPPIARPAIAPTSDLAAASIPVGRALAVPPPPVPENLPSEFAFALTNTAAAKAPSSTEPQPARKNRSWLMVAGLGGLCLTVAIVGGSLLYLNNRTPQQAGDDIATVASEIAAAGDSVVAAAEGEANPATITTITPAVVKPTAARTESALTPLKQIQSITRWSPLQLPHQFKSKSTRVLISQAWLATDETGTRVPLDAQGAPIASAPAKFVFIEVKVTNTSGKPLLYKGWNEAGTHAALLATGDLLAPLQARAETPAITRLAALELAPEQSVTDTLIFEAPQDASAKLRLALPQSALLANAKGYCAVEISPQLLTAKPAAVFANDSLANVLSGNVAAEPARPQETSATPAATPAEPAPASAAIAAPTEPKKPDRPPTKEELNKQFEATAPLEPTAPAKSAAPGAPGVHSPAAAPVPAGAPALPPVAKP